MGARSRTSLAYELIRNHILDLELRPGELVTERRLMELSGCGRTPVREAMQHLQRDGLLRVVPFRGAFVTEISAKDVGEIGQVRELLEGFAAGLAARLIAPRDLDRLTSLLAGLEPLAERSARELFEADRAFHTLVLAASGHGRIRETISTLSDQIQRLRYLSAASPDRAHQAHTEHRAVAAALLARDAAGAASAMRSHIRHSHAHLLGILGQEPEPIMAGG